MKFHVLKNEAMADVALEAFGKTPEKLFENASLAVFEQMADTEQIDADQTVTVKLKRVDLEQLLYSFLSEIVFQKDAKRMLFKKASITIKSIKKNKIDSFFLLTAKLSGQHIKSMPRKAVRVDVKAITFFDFKISKVQTGYKAKVVLDL